MLEANRSRGGRPNWFHIGQAVMYAEGTMTRLIHATFNVLTRSGPNKFAAYDASRNLAHRAAERP